MQIVRAATVDGAVREIAYLTVKLRKRDLLKLGLLIFGIESLLRMPMSAKRVQQMDQKMERIIRWEKERSSQ